jgi:hypothetical protein
MSARLFPEINSEVQYFFIRYYSYQANGMLLIYVVPGVVRGNYLSNGF